MGADGAGHVAEKFICSFFKFLRFIAQKLGFLREEAAGGGPRRSVGGRHTGHSMAKGLRETQPRHVSKEGSHEATKKQERKAISTEQTKCPRAAPFTPEFPAAPAGASRHSAEAQPAPRRWGREAGARQVPKAGDAREQTGLFSRRRRRARLQ